jgi:hypothetical protein
MKKPLLVLLLAIVALSGCYNHAYFQSPYSGNIETYHTIPLRSDSIHSATYASGTFTAGSANERFRDNLYYFSGVIHHTHNFGSFEAYYGINGNLGNYQVDSTNGRPAAGVNESLINQKVGLKSFGGYGISGGIGYVIPFANGSEMRLPQVSFNVQKEFGNYLSFRKDLPDTAANTIFRGRVVSSIGVGMELAFKLRNGMLGLKGMGGGALVNASGSYSGNENTNYGMVFFSGTLSLVYSRFMGFGQLNFGNNAIGIQVGVQYRLGARWRH